MPFTNFMVASPVANIADTTSGGTVIRYTDTVLNDEGEPETDGEGNTFGGPTSDPSGAEKWFIHNLTPKSELVNFQKEGSGSSPFMDQPRYAFMPWEEEGEIILKVTTDFKAGQNLIFSVEDDDNVNASYSSNSVTIPLQNHFSSTQPASASFIIFTVDQLPLGVGGMRWTAGLSNALKDTYDVAIYKVGLAEPLYENEHFGFIESGYVQANIINGYTRDYYLKPQNYKEWQLLANDVDRWRPLYNFDITGGGDFRYFTGDEHDNESKQSNDNVSPIFHTGSSYLAPFATMNTDPLDHQRYIDQNYRKFATHNLNAQYFDANPLVDEGRSIYASNNGDGAGKIRFGQGHTIAAYRGEAQGGHVGVPWDDNISHEVGDDFMGTSLAHYRYPTTNDQWPISGSPYLPVRLVKRPDAELVSLGQLQQVNVSPFFWQPSFAIGNSEASPYVDRNRMAGISSYELYAANQNTLRTVPNDRDNQMVDMSYLLNDALWDRYFLSTIPQEGSLDLSGDLEWPNSRHIPNAETASAENLQDFDTAAENLYNLGAFNVNSTSVEAWKSLLTAFRDLQINANLLYDDPLNAAPDFNPGETVPVSRTLEPLQKPVRFTFDNDETSPQDFGADTAERNYYQVISGFRFLTDDMIQTLSERIVDEVRLRGPFLSLADFVNRRLVLPDQAGGAWLNARQTSSGGRQYGKGRIDSATYDPLVGLTGLNGALQRAINVSGINGGVNYPEELDTGAAGVRMMDRAYGLWPSTDWAEGQSKHISTTLPHTRRFYNVDASLKYYLDMEHIAGVPAGEFGQLMSHLPGFVTQGDLLSMIGPALTVRGDTFLIRSYGDSINPLTQEVESKAWLEAVVQRIPETVEGLDGRKFRIIAMRWLDEDDV